MRKIIIKGNKLLAVYLIWIIIHFFLWFFSGCKGWTEYWKIYPFGQGEIWMGKQHIIYWYFDPRGMYDLSEFAIYIILPFLLYLIYFFWKSDKKQ